MGKLQPQNQFGRTIATCRFIENDDSLRFYLDILRNAPPTHKFNILIHLIEEE
jgi:hypothetical protein